MYKSELNISLYAAQEQLLIEVEHIYVLVGGNLNPCGGGGGGGVTPPNFW